MKKYVIARMFQAGYWSSIYEDYKGFRYAARYDHIEDAEKKALELEDVVQIIPIYT